MTSTRGLSLSASSIAATRSLISSSPNRLSGGSSRTTWPISPSRSYRTLGTELLRETRELLVLGGLWVGRQAQPVVRVARDDVDVRVEYGLHRHGLGRLQRVDALAVQPVAHALRDALRHLVGGGQIVGVDV